MFEVRPKIIHIITSLFSGGAPRMLYKLITEGLQNSYENFVICLSENGFYGPLLKEIGIPFKSLNMRPTLPSVSGVRQFYSNVHSINPDIIQGWMYHGNLAAWMSKKFMSEKPTLMWNIRHSLYGLKNEKLLTRQVIRGNRLLSTQVNGIIYNSRLSKQQHEEFGFCNAHSRVIPNGFDLSQWNPAQDKRISVRKELGIPEDVLVIGHVARLHPMKDHPRFLRVANRLSMQNRNVHFLLVGRGVVSENETISNLISEKVAMRFHFLGERNDIPDLMQAIDICCLNSSWGEAFPNVLGEALATEVPCVSTDVGDSKDIVFESGIIVPPSDENALYSALEKMVNLPQQERLKLGRAGRKRIESQYSLNSVVQQYMDLYDNCFAI